MYPRSGAPFEVCTDCGDILLVTDVRDPLGELCDFCYDVYLDRVTGFDHFDEFELGGEG